MYSFDIGKWVMKLIYSSSSFMTLIDFSRDKDAFNAYMNNLSFYKYENDGSIMESDDITVKKSFEKNLKEEVEHSLQNYSNQTIVMLSTYIETMHSEFFEGVFRKNNQFIYEYVSDSKDKKGFIRLNLIFESESKEEIIDNLIIQAKKNVVNGSLERINQRIFKLTKYKIDKQLIQDIQLNILDKRNNIVHEASSPMIEKEEITLYFGLVEKYLFELGRACKKSGVLYDNQGDWI